jgi:hypothetical protein
VTKTITAIEGPKGVAFVVAPETGPAWVEWKGDVVGRFTAPRARFVAEIVATRGKVPTWATYEGAA